MYTSVIKKVLFSEVEYHYHDYATMIIPLLGIDTEITALAGLCAEMKVDKNVIAAIVVWIHINRPECLAEFVQAYGRPAKVYDAISHFTLPPKLSEHLKLHEAVSAIINPTASKCKDERVLSIDLKTELLAKAPITDIPLASKEWYDGYNHGSEEEAIAVVKEYFQDKYLDILFVGSFDTRYLGWLHNCYDDVEVKNRFRGDIKYRRVLKKYVPSLYNVVVSAFDVEITSGRKKKNVYGRRDNLILSFRMVGTTLPNVYVIKVHEGNADNARLIDTIATFECKKIIHPTNYIQIIKEIEKLPIKNKPEEVLA